MDKQSLTFWEIGCILGSAVGVPTLVLGGHLSATLGPGPALTSIWIGNSILWLLGLAIVFMSGKSNAIQNINVYLGQKAAWVGALVVVFAFIFWYALEIQDAAKAIGHFAKITPIQVGIVLGFLTAFLSIFRLKMIRWICIFCAPLLVVLSLVAMVVLGKIDFFTLQWSLSGPGILEVILIWLAGTVNLPTFFRHVRSKSDAVLGLALFSGIHIFLQMVSVVTGIHEFASLGSYPISATVFILFTYMAVNVVNIYYASAAWETIFPRHRGLKEFAIIGFLGTLLYVFAQTMHVSATEFNIWTAEMMATGMIVNLTVVLVIDFLLKSVVKHRPRPFEQAISVTCWILGSVTSCVIGLGQFGSLQAAILSGVGASVLCFLVVAFIEETLWSFRNIF